MSHASIPNDPDAGAREALRLIGPDPQNWVPERADRDGRPIDHNVVIVGGGQSGCAFALALRRAGIGRVSVIDMAEDENRAGVWRNAARMNVLRTPKTLPGPELGIPALGFQAWYEARNGSAAYEAFARIPREAWAEYLAWYRRFLGIAVRYRTRLARIEPADGHFRLHLETERRRDGRDRAQGDPRQRRRRQWRAVRSAGAEREAAARRSTPILPMRSISRRCAASGWR